MQKKYDIDIIYLKQLQNKISNLESLDSKKDFVLLDILIEKMITNFEAEDFESTTPLEQLKEDLEYFRYYKNFYPYIRKTNKTGISISEPAVVTYDSVNISDSDALTLADSFFLKQGKFFHSKFKKFMNVADNHLKFIPPSQFTDGEIVYLSSLGEGFVISPNHANFTKVTILIHELEHIIDSYNNSLFYKNVVIRECITMFMELIATDDIALELGLTDANLIRRFFIHTLVKANTNFLHMKNQLLYLSELHKEMSLEDIIKILHDEYGFSGGDIKYLESTSIVNDYYYQISYLIAIELYSIYQIDKQKALDIAIDIVLNGNDLNIITLLNKHRIKLTDSLLSYENKLCLDLKI